MASERLHYSAVAFLDVLGFAAMVGEDAASGSPRHLEIFLSVIEDFSQIPGGEHIGIRMFSDSIIMETALTPTSVANLFAAVSWVQRRFLDRLVLLRGGIGFGRHFSDDKVIYSEALVTAYYLESRRARYPRVLIDANLWDWFANHADTTADTKMAASAALLRDRDGEMFIAFLGGGDLSSSYASINGLIGRNCGASEGVLEKIRWIADYHNYVAKLVRSDNFIVSASELSIRAID